MKSVAIKSFYRMPFLRHYPTALETKPAEQCQMKRQNAVCTGVFVHMYTHIHVQKHVHENMFVWI